MTETGIEKDNAKEIDQEEEYIKKKKMKKDSKIL